MGDFPQVFINQYLRASNKLKKFDRVVFKRFAPNVSEVLDEFIRLSIKFEEAGIYQYAAMCHLGVAKCEMYAGNRFCECQAYLKAARAFLKTYEINKDLELRSAHGEYREGALRCYAQAVERCADDSAMKAAIIREMSPLQPHFDETSSFNSPAHRIHDLEQAAFNSVQVMNFIRVLQHNDDIFDNITERKCQDLYVDLLRRVEIMRVLLLIYLNLPPSRQSPSHIKLLDYYWQVGQFEEIKSTTRNWERPGAVVPLKTQYWLGNLVVGWCEHNYLHMKESLRCIDKTSLNSSHRCVLSLIAKNILRHI